MRTKKDQRGRLERAMCQQVSLPHRLAKGSRGSRPERCIFQSWQRTPGAERHEQAERGTRSILEPAQQYADVDWLETMVCVRRGSIVEARGAPTAVASSRSAP